MRGEYAGMHRLWYTDILVLFLNTDPVVVIIMVFLLWTVKGICPVIITKSEQGYLVTSNQVLYL